MKLLLSTVPSNSSTWAVGTQFSYLRKLVLNVSRTSAKQIQTVKVISFSTLTGNTRVITQNALQTFQEEMSKVKNDPYKVVMQQTKLPVTLLNERAKVLNYIIISPATK